MRLFYDLSWPSVRYEDLSQREGVVRPQQDPVLPDDLHQQVEGGVIVHQGVGPELAEELPGREVTVRGTEVWPDVVAVLDSAHGVGEGTAAMSEADLQSREVVKDAAHQEGDDGGGGLGRHPDQPGQPVLGEPAAHLHVPGVDEQHRPGVLTGLTSKVRTETGEITSNLVHGVELLGVEVPVSDM